MKEVDIISKVVGRDTSGKTAMYIPGAGAPSVDLDDYLLKKIWDSVFEVRTDGEGNTYLFEKLPFVTQYGITMYANGGDLNLPSIYAGLPIDNSTLIRDDNGVLMINPDIDLGGGASTLGELSNVGSWADLAPTQGRLLYQDAGSSEWSYINLSSLSQAAVDMKKLSSWYGVSEDNNMLNRPTTANTIWIDKSVRYYLATSAMTTGKPEADGFILHFSWDNAGWNSQLYIPNSSIRPIQLRTPIADQATTWSEWFSVLDSRGGTINGSLSIQSIKIHDTNVIDGIDNRNLWLNYYSSGAVCLCKGGGNVGIGVDNTNKATEKITILNSTKNTNTFVYCKREDTGYGLSFGLGSGGINRGIWDDYFGKWILYTDTLRVNLTQNVWLSQDGWGNGLYLNRTTLDSGAAVTICSVGKIIGRFGINGSRNFQVSMASSNTAEDDTLKFQVDASGNGLFYGGITMYSDIRKKTKLQDVELTLQQIADAPLIEHYYNSDAMRTTHVGSIAQYWAGLNDWFCKKDSEGFYTMEIQNAALASAISIARELVKYETKTDKEIRLLKDEVKRLKKEIKILKSA
mgnify:CR=1 FL=1